MRIDEKREKVVDFRNLKHLNNNNNNNQLYSMRVNTFSIH